MSVKSRIAANAVVYLCAALLGLGADIQAQTSRVPFRQRTAVALPVPPAPGPTPSAPGNLTATSISDRTIDLTWNPSTESGGTISVYHIERCQNALPPAAPCNNFVEINTSNTTSYTDEVPPSLPPPLNRATRYRYRVRATDAAGINGAFSAIFTVRTTHYTCVLFPTRPGCMDFGTDRNENINAFYNTNGSLSFFNQIKSIYNGASGSATVSADLTTLNFSNGMQVNVTTNIQAGSSGTTTNVAAGTVPTLSSNGAAQATQNVLYGGTLLASELYPVVAAGGSKLGSPGGLGLLLDVILKEGVDIQNFKSGTSVNVSSPPFHASAQMEGYVQYNSINLAPGSSIFAGALFVGGSYGYTYISHGYARDYGFGSRVHNDIGQVSAGILINGTAKISVSRAFGPPQTFIDSTTMAQTKTNNFKAWSFGIAYQSSAK